MATLHKLKGLIIGTLQNDVILLVLGGGVALGHDMPPTLSTSSLH